jgi:hypothetical protein
MAKYSDEEIRNLPKVTIKIAADYLGISPNMLTLGMRNDLLPIGFAVLHLYAEEYLPTCVYVWDKRSLTISLLFSPRTVF